MVTEIAKIHCPICGRDFFGHDYVQALAIMISHAEMEHKAFWHQMLGFLRAYGKATYRLSRSIDR